MGHSGSTVLAPGVRNTAKGNIMRILAGMPACLGLPGYSGGTGDAFLRHNSGTLGA